MSGDDQSVDEQVRIAVEALNEFVGSTRLVLDALESGRAYLEEHYPEAKAPLKGMLEQMRSTVVGAITVAGIIPDASAIDPTSADLEGVLDRHLRSAQQNIGYSEEDISHLHGSCTRIGTLQERLSGLAGNDDTDREWGPLLGRGLTRRRAGLAESMEEIYENDGNMIRQVAEVLAASTEVTHHVQAVLRTRSADEAWRTLDQHAAAFAPLVDDLEGLHRRFNRLMEPAAVPAN